jgi:hypothetical protein
MRKTRESLTTLTGIGEHLRTPNRNLAFLGVLSVLIGVCQIFFCQPVFPQEDRSIQFERMAGAPESFENHFEVTRRGIRRDAMRLIAPVSVRTPLDIRSDGMVLDFFAAPVFNIGDGMTLEVLLTGDQGEDVLYSRSFDAGRKAVDREWTHIAIQLPIRPRARWLVLRVSGGPQGNLEADWLAIASMNLSRKAP